MTDEQPKRGPGRPRVYGKRQNFNFRITDETKARLIESAERNGRSLSEEIEHCLGRYHDIEAAYHDIDEARRQARALVDTSRVKAIREAGLQILREIDGKPTRAIVDLETLLAEADGVMRGLRPGFIDDPAPAASQHHAPTQVEWDQRAAKLEEIKREIDEAIERTRTVDESRFALLYRAVELKLELGENPTEAELHELNQYCEAIGRLHKLAEARRSKPAAGDLSSSSEFSL